ncbi:hypothetical protein E2562_030376 [Oryza meyeriana var. granulata]|uniref:Uncharacterized protein n=1 Tax=Oryza meyeriana var. granulata TaxID=110450 RepID=A0A6G1DQA3_9ORYZ|nr:hypothetical protein E2562_030376 [Oryza meyeriana var. granulata]
MSSKVDREATLLASPSTAALPVFVAPLLYRFCNSTVAWLEEGDGWPDNKGMAESSVEEVGET